MSGVEPRLPFLDTLGNLTEHADLEHLLSAALHEATQATDAQGSSLLLVGDHSVRLRQGELSTEIEDQVSVWEERLRERLGAASRHIPETQAVPISTHIVEGTGHLLANAPLLQDDMVTGCVTMVFSPGHALSLSQRQALIFCARSIGNVASIVEQLTTTQNSLKQLGFLYETSQALTSTLDLREVLDHTMALAATTLDASGSTLMLLKDDTKELVFEIPHGEKREQLRSYHMPIDTGIAGWVVTHGKPAIVNDVSQDERFSRDVDVRTGFLTRSVICVPLQIKDRTIGVLEVLNKISSEGFTDDDLRLLSTLAAQAAIAIENARLYRSLAEERDKIVKVQEQARRELARDLHDSTVQTLASLTMQIEYMKQLVEHEPDTMLEQLDVLQEMAMKASRQARTLLFELRPIVLETQGLVTGLKAYLEQLQREGRPLFHFNDGGFRGRLSSQVEATAFTIIQEAMNNARRHASPQNVWVNVAEDGEHLQIAVEDDGQGFDVAQTQKSYDQHNHLGLLSMQERAELIDARLSIESELDKGTKVVLRVPLSTSADQA